MLDGFLIFLLKITSVAFLIVIIIIFICSVLIVRFLKWKKQRKKGSRGRLSHHPHHHHQSHRRSQQSHANDANQLEGYLVENAETGSTGKVTPEDVPPYDHPPAYESLFGNSVAEGSSSSRLLDAMIFLNEVVISPVGIHQQGSSSKEESTMLQSDSDIGTSV